ncbi:hypothetical protein ABZP36_022633 [Zizania latifolia]
MSQLPPPLAVADVRGRKKRAGLPKLLHKFFKVLRLRPASAGAAEPGAAAFEAYYGYRMVDEYYYYSYGGAGSAWAGVLSSIPEEEESSPKATPSAAATLRKAHSDSDQLIAAEAAAVVHLQVVL